MNRKRKYRYLILAFLALDLMLMGWLGYRILDRKIPDQILVDHENSREVASLLKRPFVSFDDAIAVSGKDSYTLHCRVLGVIPFKDVKVKHTTAKEVYVSGAAVGIYMQTKGVLIIDTGEILSESGETEEPARDIVKPGDYIVAFNQNRIQCKQDLLEDIEEGRFIVCLVPKIDTLTGEVGGAEAVVRYHHKDLGIVDPGRYLNMLEETKLSHYLDLYVFEEVCKTLHKWEVRDIPMIPVSVNFAGATLRQEGLADKMLHLIEKHHVRCEYLEVEVSESSSDMNQEMLAETSSKIRKGNVRVILDHFGAKDSSFSILSLMEFDGLKLDKSVISNIVGNGRSRIVAQAVIDICRQLGASVQAAGVETQDQFNVLREIGCDYAQGTLFNKPITIETFEVRYLRDR